MTALGFSLVGVALGFDAAAICYVVKGRRYNRATDAYLRGDVRRGDELLRVAEDTMRWLP